MEDLYIINKNYSSSQIIKKSEFITNVFCVKNIEEINNYLKETKKKYYDATHNCYAYVLGLEEPLQIKASDDGEPSKTAGAPILEVIQKNNLTNILVVVTRYFGGIKLGAGGLTRAYSSSASQGLEKIEEKIKIEPFEKCIITINYDKVNETTKYIDKYKIENKTFLKDVNFSFIIPEKDHKKVLDDLTNLTNGQINFKFEKHNII